MRKIVSLLLSVTLAAAVALGLPARSLAAEASKTQLSYCQTEQGNVVLAVTGIAPEKVIHGVQMEITLNGTYQPSEVALKPENGFSPDFSTLVSQSGGKTTVTLYLVSAYALNHQSTLALGELTANGQGVVPEKALLALLDYDMIQNGPGAGNSFYMEEVEVTRDPNSVELGEFYSISGSGALHGTVTAPSTARENQRVEVQTTPDQGYRLESFKVSKTDGTALPLEDLGEGRYAFTMPAAPVTLQGVFVPLQSPKMPFTDVEEGKWYYEYIQYVYDRGMMKGSTDTLFEPAGHTSRGMLVAILHRLEGSPKQGSNQFTDVAPGRWYTEPIAWATANDIVDGYGNGRFGPNDKITREQMATILYRYAKYKGYDLSAQGNMEQFVDRDQVSKFAKEAIPWAVGTGLINGKGGGKLEPKGFATRAEAAAIVTRFCQKIA